MDKRTCGGPGIGGVCNAPATRVAFLGVAHYGAPMGDAYDECADCAERSAREFGARIVRSPFRENYVPPTAEGWK